MRDGVSGVFVVSVGQGGLRRSTVVPQVISVWKTVISETVWELGFEVGVSVAEAKKVWFKDGRSGLCLELGTA
jgi:hypothetical protein